GLVDVEQAPHWDSRGHFFAAAAEAMRRILVENVRRKKSKKRGGDGERVPLDQIEIALPTPDDDLLALDEALTRLAAERPAVAELVKLRFFAGQTMDEAAQMLGISPATAYRQWSYAGAGLFRPVSEARQPPEPSLASAILESFFAPFSHESTGPPPAALSYRGTAMDEEAIFTAALELESADQRAAYLDAACGGQAGL